MPTVLVADDCLTDRRRAGGLLTRAGFEVRYAVDGRDALDQAAAAPPDAVLTDMQMPELDGLGLVMELVRGFPRLPVVLMTSLGSEELAVQALQAGASSYVPKRQLAGQLVEIMRRLCDAASETRGLDRVRDRMTHSEVRYVLECDLSLIGPTVRTVRELLAASGRLEETALLRTGIAVEEAMLNAVYHGNLEVSSDLREDDPNAFYDLARRRCEQQPYRDRTTAVEVLLTQDAVRVRVRDEGPGFDPATLPDPTDPENLARASGRGLLLIRTFMDEVDHNARGNEITLVKRFAPKSAPLPAEAASAVAAGH